MIPAAPPTGQRSQSGVTLVEVLVASAVAAIIGIPMLSWLNTTVRSSTTVTEQLGRSNETGLLNTYFARDVATALSVDTASAADCIGGQGAGGRPVLVVVTAGADPQRIVYSEAGSSTAGASASLWRRTCDDGATPGVDAVELVRNLVPYSALATCPAAGPVDCTPASTQVELSVTPESAGRPVVARATRRATADSVGSRRPGNTAPNPSVRISQRTGYRGTEFVLDATGSTDRDGGGPLAFQWSFSAPSNCTEEAGGAIQRCRFDSVGDVDVVLGVGDGTDVRSVGLRITVSNRAPIAQALAGAAVVAPGDTLVLDASGSNDPDGDTPLGYAWDLGEGFPDSIRYRSGVTTSVTIPPDAPGGPRQIRLTVTDTSGASDTEFVSVDVAGGPTESLLEVSPPPVVVAGRPVPLLGTGVSTGSGPGAGFTASFALNPSAPEGYTVALFRAGSVTPVSACDGSARSCPGLSFLGGESGEWDAVVCTDPECSPAGAAERLRFRVGRKPTAAAAVVATGGTVPKVVSFTSAGSNDTDGVIVSRIWDFGCGPGCTSSDTSPVHRYTTPGTYVVTLVVVDDDGQSSLTTLPPIVVGTPP